jgi:dienelactone hydrolase
VATEADALGGKAVRKQVVLHFGAGERAVALNVSLYVPAKAAKPAPVVLQLLFSNPPGIPQLAKMPFNDAVPAEDIVGRGYAYAAFRYTEAQADNAKTSEGGVQALAYGPGQTRPAAGEWGTIAVWAWITSRVLDYLETEATVDAKRVALVGHSRLGKTALWAGARDPRFAAVFASCSGEMGASLARRDYGESVDDVAANFPWWLVATFPKYAGRWNELPVDSHMVIALNAPRPVFVTGGTEDQWADPHGEFLAVVAAGPVYRLLGTKDVGSTVRPALDVPLISGSLGFLEHTGKHVITEGDWNAFFAFAGRHFGVTGR